MTTRTFARLIQGLFACAVLLLGVRGSARGEDGEEPGGEGDKAEAPEAPGAEEEAEEVPDPVGEEVRVGAYINDIQVVDLKTHSYEMDVYVWFRWKYKGFDPVVTVETVNPNELWGQMVLTAYEEPDELENGELYQVVRYQGRFSRKMPLYNYPYDRQVLTLMLEDARFEADGLVFVPDAGAIAINPKLTLPGYSLGTPTLDVKVTDYPTSFGDPRLTSPARYSRIHIDVPITRPKLAYSAKLLLPVGCVILCAAMMFLLAPSYVDSRVDVGITSLLTIVALQMTFNQDVPDVGYLMLMDKIYICSYLFVIFGLLFVVRTTRMVDQGRADEARKMHGVSLLVLFAVYVLATGALVGQAMRAG